MASIAATEMMRHSSPKDCWVAINGKVYDMTNFAPEHPGGHNIIYAWAGKDASDLYNEFHSARLVEQELPASAKLGSLDDTVTKDDGRSSMQQAATTTTHSASEQRPPLTSIINLHDFELAFAKFGSRKSHAYISSASNDLLTLQANAAHWHKLWFRPRVLRNVSTVSTRTRLLGLDVSMPVWIAPMGMGKTGGPEAEAALGAGAAAAGIVHCLSTPASLSVEETLASAPGHPWFFQLYVNRDRAKTEAALAKLARHRDQVKALFVTADLPVMSKREADDRIRVTEQTVLPLPDSTGATIAATEGRGGLARTTGSFIDSSFTWECLPWLRRCTDLPLFVKGVQTAADARAALEAGCAGIVVSNHGGRALDNASSTVLVLLELRRDCPEVFERMDILVDGGVRRGSDVLKAFCLGARGVGVGRPFQCAISYGKEGVAHCANILREELETAMRLCGVTDINSVWGNMAYLNTSELDTLLPAKQDSYPRLRSRCQSGREVCRL
ncbi:uncharacterized protein PG998_005020 [Apiospora kogelbergensis]|uniref:uncharacterized protein n=1 Tax=Apiospora kogelbergensis TaxID=1337665 RepID=UPI00312CD038